jgi:hypothetical protein
MSLKQWENDGWLHPHSSSAQEIFDLLAIVDRDPGGLHPRRLLRRMMGVY